MDEASEKNKPQDQRMFTNYRREQLREKELDLRSEIEMMQPDAEMIERMTV